MNRSALVSMTLAFTVLAGCLGGDGDRAPVSSSASRTPAPMSSPTPGSARPTLPLELAAAGTLPDLVERLQRSVVAIGTVSGDSLRGGAGLGSGVVIDRDGYILTNFHVVQGAQAISIKFFDGTLAEAVVVGVDPGSDLAVVKATVPPERLAPAIFGDSDKVRPGEFVFAIGNPFSFEFTVTFGIVSGVQRDALTTAIGRPIRGVIQTDAAVNPGNSGGPLFNLDGEVIGINTAIENPSGQRVFVGVGLAVSSNTAQRFLPKMIAGEIVRHPQLGVQGIALNEVSAKDAGVSATTGVYVVGVANGSSASRAGLRAASVPDGQGVLMRGGDVITAFDGAPVNTVEELARQVDLREVGDSVRLTIVRGQERLDLTATLGEWLG